MNGGDAAIIEAGLAVQRLLDSRYRKLLNGLIDGFLKEHHDPIQDAIERLTTTETSRAKRSDSQRRRTVLAEVARLSERLQPQEIAA